MTEIMRSPAHLASPPSSITSSNDGFHQLNHGLSFNASTISSVSLYRRNHCTSTRTLQQQGEVETEEGVLAVLATVLRKSLVGCKSVSAGVEEYQQPRIMEIGCPTNVRHVAHVTFDRFNGFLGLPVEFEPEVPIRPPSASTRVFGVSTESMQLSFDSRGNCVPTILLMMQRRLYSQAGLQAEGIFRINPENGQEEYVREQLNNGLIPENIDVHCLAGLIKAWFRELPRGILDCLSPELVMQAISEEECVHIVRLLPSTEAALLDWAINLMADVAQMEHLNKMNARNIAMVFAPNMTQMSDPLTALMYAVQVMNFLKNLVVKTLREREDSKLEADPLLPYLEHSDEDGSFSKPIDLEGNGINEEEESILGKETLSNHMTHPSMTKANKTHGLLCSIENIIPEAKGRASGNSSADNSNFIVTTKIELEGGNTATESVGNRARSRRTKTNQDQDQASNYSSSVKKELRTNTQQPVVIPRNESADKIISCVNSHTERVEAWR